MNYISSLFILKNIIDSSKIIDIPFIYSFWKDYIDHFDLIHECSNISFVNERVPYGIAGYSSGKREVIFNVELMKKDVILCAKKYNLEGSEYYCYVNLKMLEIILHEFEHIIQEKKFNIDVNDLESELISWCKMNIELWGLNNSYEYNYTDTYKYNPCERLAELYSYKSILNIVKIFGYNLNMVNNLLKTELSFVQLNGYNYEKDIICPTESYFMNTGLEPIWYNMDFYSSDRDKMLKNVQNMYNFEKRILFGLPISNLEVKKLINKSLISK